MLNTMAFRSFGSKTAGEARRSSRSSRSQAPLGNEGASLRVLVFGFLLALVLRLLLVLVFGFLLVLVLLLFHHLPVLQAVAAPGDKEGLLADGDVLLPPALLFRLLLQAADLHQVFGVVAHADDGLVLVDFLHLFPFLVV